MCDTVWFKGNTFSIFGKNSDRNAQEAQTVELVPKRDARKETAVGQVKFPIQDQGFAYCASVPIWMDGAEMGVNEWGVAIGNEAVFSRFPRAKTGIPGMVFLKTALMTSKTADEALQVLITLTETQKQGGRCSYRGSLMYDSSYLICDRDKAFVLETAGHYWAWKEAGDRSAISNAYSITTDFKRLDAYTRKMLAPVNPQMACLDEADAGRIGEKSSWKAFVEQQFINLFTRGDRRRMAVQSALNALTDTDAASTKAQMDVQHKLFSDMLAILRSHNLHDENGRTVRVCNHDHDLTGNPTTASLLVQFPSGTADFLVWFTGASYPCANLYKPILCRNREFIPLWTQYDYTPHAKASVLYWQYRREKLKHVRSRPAKREEPELQQLQEIIYRTALDVLHGTQSVEAARTAIHQAVEYWDTRTL